MALTEVFEGGDRKLKPGEQGRVWVRIYGDYTGPGDPADADPHHDRPLSVRIPKPVTAAYKGAAAVVRVQGDGLWQDFRGGDSSHIPGGPYNAGIIWWISTEWRVDCDVQAQAHTDAPGKSYGLFSPTRMVC